MTTHAFAGFNSEGRFVAVVHDEPDMEELVHWSVEDFVRSGLEVRRVPIAWARENFNTICKPPVEERKP